MIISILLGVAVILVASLFVQRSASVSAMALGWLGVIGGCLAIYLGELSQPAAWLGVACLAGPAVALVGREARRAHSGSLAVVASVAAALIFGSLMDAESTRMTGHALMLTACWAAMIGSLALATSAAVVPLKHGWGPSVGLCAAAGPLGALIVGSSRNSVSEFGYFAALQYDGVRVHWVLPAVREFENGLRLIVSLAFPDWVVWACVAAAVSGVVATLALRSSRTRMIGSVGLALSVLCGLVVLFAIATVTASQVPDPTAYEDFARSAVLAAKGSESVVAMGGFEPEAVSGVARGSMSADFGLLVYSIVVVLVGFLLARRSEAEIEDSTVRERRLEMRDLMVRSVCLGWLSWFMVLVLNEVFLGTAGFGTSGEWVHLGLLTTATGLVFFGWRGRDRLEQAVSDLSPGLFAFGWILFFATAFAFGAVPGFSLSIY